MTNSSELLERTIDNCSYNIEAMSSEQIKNLILQSWIEVQNGLKVECVNFYHYTLSKSKLKQVIKNCISEIKDISVYKWNVEYFIIDFIPNNISLISTYENNGYKSNPSKVEITQQELNTLLSNFSIKGKVFLLDGLTDKLRNLNKESIPLLINLSSDSHLLTSTLASELLTLQGIPTVPEIYVNKHIISHPKEQKLISDKKYSLMFEDRIDVDSYNYFELVHPAYAKQVVTLIKFIELYFPESQYENNYILDFGTGPGTPLIMLMESLPLLKVHAVEPSPVAFSYLKENMSSYHSRVTIEENSFLDIQLPEKVPVIMSIGASHHFNTYFLFQKANELLRENGILLIADEFISPYSSKEERKRNLILHHTTYMKNLLIHPNEKFMQKLTKEEVLLIEIFENYVPMIIFLAHGDDLHQSVILCKELFDKAHNIKWKNTISHPLVAFYRLQLLELEALVAGIDYEVEQKTYPQRFCEMASLCGFNLINHKKIYSTTGNDEFDGGTHVFAFKKEVDYGQG